MAWIESHDEVAHHRKTRRAARALGVPVPHVVGLLHVLWHWCLTHAPDGDLSGLDAEDLADACMWDGDPQALHKALRDTGWIDHDGQVHDWWEHGGQTVARRRQATEAQREAGVLGAHRRWCVGEGKPRPGCPHCDGVPMGSDRVPNPPHVATPMGSPSGPMTTGTGTGTGTEVKGASSRERSARATRIPDSWVPGEEPELHGEAKAAGVDLHRELARFGDYWRAKGGKDGRKVDWQATWRNWVRKAIDDKPRANGHSRDGPSSADRYRQAAEEARRREAPP